MGDNVDTVVNLCEGISFNTVVQVFEGSCSDLVCVGGNNDGNNRLSNCRLGRALSWFAEAGKKPITSW
jgi:hypothetical protein